MKKFIKKLTILYTGFVLIAFGSSVMIHVSYVGLEPWSAFHLGLAGFSLSVGLWTMLIQGIFIFLAFILERKPPGIGTFLNTISIGPMIDFFLSLNLISPIAQPLISYLIFIFGVVISSFGIGLAIISDLGAGAKTHFYVVIHKQYNISLSKAKGMMELSGLLFAILVGGPIFWGTVIFAFISGPLVQSSVSIYEKFKLLK